MGDQGDVMEQRFADLCSIQSTAGWTGLVLAFQFDLQILNAHNFFCLSRKNQSTENPLTPFTNTAKMGRVRTKTVKKSAKVIIERYYPKLTLDFETNKRICDEIAVIASKRLRNKVRITRHLTGRLGN
jgi:ribosomal protein S17E